jgi:hypothetical protein
MAGIDVSELLNDPDFTDKVTLITRALTLVDGRTSLVENIIPNLSMSIQPASGSDLKKLPEGARGSEALAVWYQGELASLRQNGYSDIIVWNNKRYEVQHVEPYGNWGNGYYKGIATLTKVGNG